MLFADVGESKVMRLFIKSFVCGTHECDIKWRTVRLSRLL